MKLDTQDYRDNASDYNGYCTKCDYITRIGSTEPDAENYPCTNCNTNSVMGIENAMIMGLIEIKD